MLLVLVHLTAPSVVVNISGVGAVRGTALSEGTAEFLSIPYAAPPTGGLRFLPSKPALPWDGILDATHLKHACRQATTSVPAANQSEDCLSLNIWAPLRAPTAPLLPVYVFIHGGAFTVGYGAQQNGSALSERAGGIVVVNMNYRLGPLGFFSGTMVKAGAEALGLPPALGGMNGVLDQQLALRWVHEHIAHFGGDPKRITLGGESAGAVSVCLHAHSPVSAAMIQAAVLESGECTGPWGPWNETLGLSNCGLFTKALGVSTLAELQAVPLDTMLDSPLWGQVNPSVDGYMFPAHPSVLPVELAGSKAVIIGANALDTLCAPPFGMRLWPVPWPANESALMTTYTHWFPDEAETVLRRYPPAALAPGTNVTGASESALSFLRATRDTGTSCPAAWFADKLRAAGSTVFVYQFGFSINASWPYAGHGDELGYCWLEPMQIGGKHSMGDLPAAAQRVARQMADYWATFVADGNPRNGSGDAPMWPPYGRGQRAQNAAAYLSFGVAGDVAVRVDFHGEACEFWSSYAAQGPTYKARMDAFAQC